MNQRAHNIDPPRLWQWPNLLGIDAAIIAVSWFWLLSPESVPFPKATAAVLALSIWLTYLADRLLDVRNLDPAQLNSLRHRFAYQKKRRLWQIWWFLLFLNVIMALSYLSQSHLVRGSILLFVTLGYTLAVQHCKLPHLLKEGLVGFIFTAGVLIFLDAPLTWLIILALFLLFTGNCTLIAEKELDEPFTHKSANSRCSSGLSPFILASAACSSIIASPLMLTTLVPITALYIARRQFTNETYRTLIDASLLSTPLFVFIARLVF